MTAAAPSAAPADDFDDLDLVADHRFRPSRLTVALLGAIAAVLVFTGGVLVQKHWGPSSSAAAAPRGGAGFAAGRTGGYGQFGGAAPGAGGGFGGGAPGGGQGPAGGSAGAAASATPVVVGTVSKLSSSRLVVKNLGGRSVTVKLPAGATITLVAGSSVPVLKKGATVSVAGRTAADGTVTATSVTVRS